MKELRTDVHPTLTRRRFVLAGGAAVAGVCVIGVRPAAAASAPAYLRRSSYEHRVGASFRTAGATGAAVTLRLIAVADLVRARQTSSLAGRDDAFALTFSGPGGAALGSGVRRLRHPSLGWVSLFVSPVGRPSPEQLYEVVVDRAGVG